MNYLDHKRRSGVNVWGFEGFLPEFPQTSPKHTPKKINSKNTTAMFQMKELQAPFLPNLP